MQNNRTLIILAAVFVVLLLVYVAVKNTSVPTAETSWLVEVDTTEVSEISIYHDGQTVTLKRGGDGWSLVNPVDYPANPRYVQQMLEKLAQLRIESLISEDEQRWAEFEVDTAGIQVSVNLGDGEETFIIGKAAEAYRQSYARRADEKAIYLVKGTYGTALKRPADQWRDKRIILAEPQDVRGIVLNGDRLVKQTEERAFYHVEGTDSTKLDWNKVARVQSAATRLQTSSWPEEAEYQGVDWNDPEGTLTLELAGGGEETVRFFQDREKENRYFVLKEGEDTVFIVYKGVFNQIFKPLAELMPEAEEA